MSRALELASRHRLPILLLLGVVLAFAAGAALRRDLDVDWSAASVQATVLGMGAWAPVLFVGFVVFRNFLLLPSMVVLTAGGLIFGAALGTALGGLGIVLSALLKFGLARSLGREWVRSNMGPRAAELERRLEATGPVLVGVCTAHPMGPLSPVHWGSGLASVPWLPFAVAVTLAGPVRASAYAWFGSSLLDPGSPRFWATSGVLAAVAFLPLLHPGLRRWIRGAAAQ